jgi:hypothetical protein
MDPTPISLTPPPRSDTAYILFNRNFHAPEPRISRTPPLEPPTSPRQLKGGGGVLVTWGMQWGRNRADRGPPPTRLSVGRLEGRRWRRALSGLGAGSGEARLANGDERLSDNSNVSHRPGNGECGRMNEMRGRKTETIRDPLALKM